MIVLMETIPTSAILTSASVHDSQVAIPLAQMSDKRFKNLYDLMDAAYDSPEIHQFSQQLGHRPIIDHNPRRSGQKRKFEALDKLRYNERSSAERVNSNLKDNYGGRKIRVKGHSKSDGTPDVWNYCYYCQSAPETSSKKNRL